MYADNIETNNKIIQQWKVKINSVKVSEVLSKKIISQIFTINTIKYYYQAL